MSINQLKNMKQMSENCKYKPEDILRFEELFKKTDTVIYSELGFDKSGEIILARAPGRLDLMGGIADYCGAVVFEATLSNAVVMGTQRRKDRFLQLLSLDAEKEGLKPGFCMSIDDFYLDGKLKSYEQVQQFFRADSKAEWTGYILGAFYVLLKEEKVDSFAHGLNMVLQSDIPMGAGISSSAAIEISAMASIDWQYELGLEPLEMAVLSQIVENRIVGAPCGIMDQITIAAGKKDKIVSILCQPGEILEYVGLPEDTQLVGINSKVKRSTAGSAYIDARTAAFMGLSIIQKEFEHDELSNYLCNISPSVYEKRYKDALPTKMSGKDFLNKYGETVDTVTNVEPDKEYFVRSCVEHPIYEHHRVQEFIKQIKRAGESPEEKEQSLIKAGKLMYASNWSYKHNVNLGSPNIDILVESIRKIGIEGGFYGAKITGGGGGGTVAVLARKNVSDSIKQVLDTYSEATGISAGLFTGSSPGTMRFGCINLAR